MHSSIFIITGYLLVNYHFSKEIYILCCNDFTYLYETSPLYSPNFSIKQSKLHLSSSVFGRVSLVHYVIYSSVDAHSQQCVSAEELQTVSNTLIWEKIVFGRWNWACLIAEMQLNTMILVWWRSQKYLQHRTCFSLEWWRDLINHPSL